MQSLLQPAGLRQSKQPKHIWLRWIALACVLLVCMVSTAQVCHVHCDAALKQSSPQNGQTPEDHCPLCVAMHSALPVALHVAPEPMVQLQRVDSAHIDVVRIFRWSLEMANRPPPDQLNRA